MDTPLTEEERISHREAVRHYDAEHREEHMARRLRWKETHPGAVKEQRRRYDAKRVTSLAVKERRAQQQREKNARIKQQVFSAYGNKCACPGCDESYPPRLTIDHVDGHGNQHRKELFGRAHGGGISFYRWLVAQNFPPDYQILCWNCNLCKHLNNGLCPHPRSHK